MCKLLVQLVGCFLSPTHELLVRVLSGQWVAYILYLSEPTHLPIRPPRHTHPPTSMATYKLLGAMEWVGGGGCAH